MYFWALLFALSSVCHGRKLGRSLVQTPAQPVCSVETPSYDPEDYNKPNCPPFSFCDHLGIQESNNCYSYAINDLQDPRDPYSIIKPMPGDYRGEFLLPFQFTCPDLIGKILRDFPEITHASSDRAAPCPCGSYKVLLLLDSAAYRTLDGRDFHLTRQDNNGMWSHKIGSARVTNLDALNHTITDPFLASWNYSAALHFGTYLGHAYEPCPEGLFCVPSEVSTKARELRIQLRTNLERSVQASSGQGSSAAAPSGPGPSTEPPPPPPPLPPTAPAPSSGSSAAGGSEAALESASRDSNTRSEPPPSLSPAAAAAPSPPPLETLIIEAAAPFPDPEPLLAAGPASVSTSPVAAAYYATNSWRVPSPDPAAPSTAPDSSPVLTSTAVGSLPEGRR